MTAVLENEKMVEHLYISAHSSVNSAIEALMYASDRNENIEHQQCVETLVTELKDISLIIGELQKAAKK